MVCLLQMWNNSTDVFFWMLCCSHYVHLNGIVYFVLDFAFGIFLCSKKTQLCSDLKLPLRGQLLSHSFHCRYSFDEGESWNEYMFLPNNSQKIRVYGLLTEPGEQTAVFSIFGSAANASHSWIVIQVNLTGVLGIKKHLDLRKLIQGCKKQCARTPAPHLKFQNVEHFCAYSVVFKSEMWNVKLWVIQK